MAGLLRSVARQSCRVLVTRQAIVARPPPRCLISTSKKNKDSITTDEIEGIGQNLSEEIKKSDSLADKDENWISYGYSLTDKDTDTWANHGILFSTVTVGLLLVGFIFVYEPDHKMRDWSMREAYLELGRREKEGLPLIEKNLLPMEKIYVPTDEELGDREIIV